MKNKYIYLLHILLWPCVMFCFVFAYNYLPKVYNGVRVPEWYWNKAVDIGGMPMKEFADYWFDQALHKGVIAGSITFGASVVITIFLLCYFRPIGVNEVREKV